MISNSQRALLGVFIDGKHLQVPREGYFLTEIEALTAAGYLDGDPMATLTVTDAGRAYAAANPLPERTPPPYSVFPGR